MLEVLVFLLAFLASAAPPGPDTLTVFSRGLHGGFAKAIPFAVGVCLAKVALLSLALVGVAQIAERFEVAFVIIKFAGAIYLCVLGLQKVLQARKPIAIEQPVKERGPWQDIGVGFGLGVSNPNAVVFYVALLPSVVDPDTAGVATFLWLVAVLVVAWLAVATVYAGLANRLRSAMTSSRARRRMQQVSGATMVGAGLLVASR